MEPDETPARVVVLDAGPLIHLDELDSLELLGDYDELLVPDAVWYEVEQHRPSLLQTSSVRVSRVQPRKPFSTIGLDEPHTGEGAWECLE